MNEKIQAYMNEYKAMERHPDSKEQPLRFDRETLSIAKAIIWVYKGISNPTEDDKAAYEWAVKKMGLEEDIIHF